MDDDRRGSKLTWSEMLAAMRAVQDAEPVIPPPRVIYDKPDLRRMALDRVTRGADAEA